MGNDLTRYVPLEGRWAEAKKWEKLAKYARDQLFKLRARTYPPKEVDKLFSEIDFYISEIENDKW